MASRLATGVRFSQTSLFRAIFQPIPTPARFGLISFTLFSELILVFDVELIQRSGIKYRRILRNGEGAVMNAETLARLIEHWADAMLLAELMQSPYLNVGDSWDLRDWETRDIP